MIPQIHTLKIIPLAYVFAESHTIYIHFTSLQSGLYYTLYNAIRLYFLETKHGLPQEYCYLIIKVVLMISVLPPKVFPKSNFKIYWN